MGDGDLRDGIKLDANKSNKVALQKRPFAPQMGDGDLGDGEMGDGEMGIWEMGI